MATDKYEGRTTDDLIKGYWDDKKNAHIKGLWERVSSMEHQLTYAPGALTLVVLLQIAVLVKDKDPNFIAQVAGLIGSFFK